MKASTRVLAAATLLAALLLPGPLSAQTRRDRQRDFLFGAPKGSFRLRGGVNLARAASDIFDFSTEKLTLDRKDFSSLAGDAEMTFHASSRFEVVLGAGVSHGSRDSEFRDWVEDNDEPIRQQTRFTQVPLTLGLRYYLKPMGREISRFAWIPEHFAPYLGAGAGGLYYRFEQEGDFVDFEDLKIFSDVLQSDGWTTTGHVFAGADYGIRPWLGLTGEARLTFGSGKLERDFVGFDKIDLAGLRTAIGVYFRY